MHSTYILIDTTLLGVVKNKMWLKKNRRPGWIAAIFSRDARDVSPVLIDVAQAVLESRIAVMMEMVNSTDPKLGISFIDTNLSMTELLEHFRKFIFVKTYNDIDLTLRFADCAVLPVLASTLSPGQWAMMTSAFKSWKVHGRDGSLFQLPLGFSKETVELPLRLNKNQILAFKNASGADQLLASLRLRWATPPPFYTSTDAYSYAHQIMSLWRSTGHKNDENLLLFAKGVFDTEGRLLRIPDLKEIFENTDKGKLSSFIKRMIEIQY